MSYQRVWVEIDAQFDSNGDPELIVSADPVSVRRHPVKPADVFDRIGWERSLRLKQQKVQIQIRQKVAFPYEFVNPSGLTRGVVKTSRMRASTAIGDTYEYGVRIKGDVWSETTGKYEEMDHVFDPDIVIDDEPCGARIRRLIGQATDSQNIAVVGDALAASSRQHVVIIRVVDDGSCDPGFRAELADPGDETVVIDRSLGDSVLWSFENGTPRGYGFYCRPKGTGRWPMSHRRYNPVAEALPSGRARGSGEVEAGTYGYDIVVVDRHHPDRRSIIDPDIVIEDEPVPFRR